MNSRWTLVCAAVALMSLSALAGGATGTVGGTVGGGTSASTDTGYGTVRPFAASLEALKGPNSTDVYIGVKVEDGFDVPQDANKIQIKSLDEAGEARWTKNYQRFPLSEGRAKFAYTDLERHAPLNAQLNLKTAQTVNEEIVRASTIVMLRPDLAIDAVNAAKQVHVHEKVMVEVVVRELNQDLGASFRGFVSENGADIDTVDDAMIDAGGTASLVFVLSFDEPGVHTLVAGVRDAQPGEWSTENNTMEFQIEVKNPTEPIQYSLYYYDQTFDNEYNWNAYYGAGQSGSSGRVEGTGYSAWMPQTINWPVEDLKLELVADGNLKLAAQFSNVQPTWAWSYSAPEYQYHSEYFQAYLPDENAWVWVNSYDYQSIWGSWTGSSHGVSRWAADYVYYSRGYYDYTWDGNRYYYQWDYSGVVRQGTFWGARESVESNVTLTDDLTTYGGKGRTSNWYHYDQPRYDYSYSNEYGSWWGHYGYEYWSGWGYGLTE